MEALVIRPSRRDHAAGTNRAHRAAMLSRTFFDWVHRNHLVYNPGDPAVDR
jgi:hypothetical protein